MVVIGHFKQIYTMDVMHTVLILLVTVLVHISPAAAQSPLRVAIVIDDSQSSDSDDMEKLVEIPSLGDDVILAGDVISTRLNDSYGALTAVCEELSSGVDVIYDQSSAGITRTLRSLAESIGVGHVSVSEWPHTQHAADTSLNAQPIYTNMLQVIRDIVLQENLKKVAIFYDDSFNLENKEKSLLMNLSTQHIYSKLEDDKMSYMLETMKKNNTDIIDLFVAAGIDTVHSLLAKAHKNGMLATDYNWYIITHEVPGQNHSVLCSECGTNNNIILLTGRDDTHQINHYQRFLTTTHSNTHPDDTVINMEKAYQYDLMQLIGAAYRSVSSEYNWTTYSHDNCSNTSSTLNHDAATQAARLLGEMKQIHHTGVFGVLAWNEEASMLEQNITLDIKRVTFNDGRKPDVITIGNWSKANGVESVNGTIRRSDVTKNYRIVTVHEPPFVFRSTEAPKAKDGELVHYVKSVPDAGNGTEYYYYGYCIDLIKEIKNILNFDYELYESPDGAYGTLQPDGTWNGIVRELMNGDADIAVASLSVMAERENVIDFTVPYYDLVGITILMSKPKFEYSVFKFMTVLEEAVWGCVFSAFIIVSVLIAIFDKYSPYSYQNNKASWDGEGEEPRVFTLKEGLWFCMTSLTPQGGGEAPRALSGRLVAATWWMFGFIMIATYTANLAAFLTVSRLDQPIESLDDLAKQFKTKYSPQKDTATETYFKRMAQIEDKFYLIWKQMSLNDSLDDMERAKLAVWDYPVSDKFTNMWEAMESSGFPETFEKAIERIKNPPEGEEDYAFIGDATQNKYATLTDCGLWEVGEEFSRKPYALAVPEESPLKTELSSVLLQLLNQRVLEDLKMKWWDFNKKDCPKIEDESDGISIYNIGGVFLVIFIGIGFGLITLAFEYYWYKWRPAAKRRQEQQAANAAGMSGSMSGAATASPAPHASTAPESNGVIPMMNGSAGGGAGSGSGGGAGTGGKDGAGHGYDNHAYVR